MTVQESCRDADDDVFEGSPDGSINMPPTGEMETSYSCPVASLIKSSWGSSSSRRGTNLLFWPQIICLKHVWKLCQIYGGWGGVTRVLHGSGDCRLPCRRQMSRLMGHATHSRVATSLIKCATAATNGLQFKVYFVTFNNWENWLISQISYIHSSQEQLDIVINRHRHVD